jgi:hypothetical protein
VTVLRRMVGMNSRTPGTTRFNGLRGEAVRGYCIRRQSPLPLNHAAGRQRLKRRCEPGSHADNPNRLLLRNQGEPEMYSQVFGTLFALTTVLSVIMAITMGRHREFSKAVFWCFMIFDMTALSILFFALNYYPEKTQTIHAMIVVSMIAWFIVDRKRRSLG